MKYDFKYKGMVVFSRYYENKVKSKDKRFYKQLLKSLKNIIARQFSKIISDPQSYIRSYFNEIQIAENNDIDVKRYKKEAAAQLVKLKDDEISQGKKLDGIIDSSLKIKNKPRKIIILQLEEIKDQAQDENRLSSEERVEFSPNVNKKLPKPASQKSLDTWYTDPNQYKVLKPFTDITAFDIVKEFDEWISGYLMHSGYSEQLIESLDHFSSKLSPE